MTVGAFLLQVGSGLDGVDARQALFTAVRDMPYRTDAAHTADELLALGAGSCLAKADLMERGLRRLGYRARRVRWLYELPGQPAEVALLPSRSDIHSATEVLIDGHWRVVDATLDPALARIGLSVTSWDGVGDSDVAFVPAGPIWRAGHDDESIAAAPTEIERAWLQAPPGAGRRYRVAFNRWLDSARSASVGSRLV